MQAVQQQYPCNRLQPGHHSLHGQLLLYSPRQMIVILRPIQDQAAPVDNLQILRTIQDLAVIVDVTHLHPRTIRVQAVRLGRSQSNHSR